MAEMQISGNQEKTVMAALTVTRKKIDRLVSDSLHH